VTKKGVFCFFLQALQAFTETFIYFGYIMVVCGWKCRHLQSTPKGQKNKKKQNIGGQKK